MLILHIDARNTPDVVWGTTKLRGCWIELWLPETEKRVQHVLDVLKRDGYIYNLTFDVKEITEEQYQSSIAAHRK